MVKEKNTKKGCVLTGEGEEGEIRAKVKERGIKGWDDEGEENIMRNEERRKEWVQVESRSEYDEWPEMVEHERWVE